jgi:hypothetical protein
MKSETLRLDNGLILDISDESRKIAEKTWVISVVARTRIPVTPETLGDQVGTIPVEDIRALVGDTLMFEKKMVRNFVVENDRIDVLKLMQKNFRDRIVPYLSNEKFPGIFIAKSYKEALVRRSWRK